MGDGTEKPINGGLTGGAGINYGTGVDKYLPFSDAGSAWWNPGESTWLFGGGATADMKTQPATGDYQRGYLKNMLQRGAAQMNTGQSDQARGQQSQLAQMLFRQAQGTQQGAGEMAVQRQANRAMANQTSAAQMSRGAGAGMAQRNAARANADIGVNAAGQASIAQMQDQQSAQNQLGGLLAAQRGQDIQTAGANQQGQIAQQQMQLAALAQMLGVDKAELEQDLKKRELASQDKGQIGNLLQVFGGMMAGSDERIKTDIVDADAEVDLILAGLTPKAYRYKDEKHGRGARVGIMAQDLERTALGRNIVEDTAEGKMLDVNTALSLALAAVARLDARVRELEAKKG